MTSETLAQMSFTLNIKMGNTVRKINDNAYAVELPALPLANALKAVAEREDVKKLDIAKHLARFIEILSNLDLNNM